VEGKFKQNVVLLAPGPDSRCPNPTTGLFEEQFLKNKFNN
jgi:hypothetical protein